MFLLWTEFAELSFLSPSSPNSVPESPQNLCTPQLLQLLTPIFSPMTPPPSSPSSESDAELVDESFYRLHFPHLVFFSFVLTSAHQSSSEETLDTRKVERFFTIWPEESQEEEEKPKVHINVRKETF